MDIRPEEEHRAPRLPSTVTDVAITLGKAASGGHQQRPGEVGRGLGQDPGVFPTATPRRAQAATSMLS